MRGREDGLPRLTAARAVRHSNWQTSSRLYDLRSATRITNFPAAAEEEEDAAIAARKPFIAKQTTSSYICVDEENP